MTRSSSSRSPSRSTRQSRRVRSRSSRRNEDQPKESTNDSDRHYRRYDEGDPIYRRNDHDPPPRRSRSREKSDRHHPSHHQGNHTHYRRGHTHHHQSDYYAHRIIEREQTSFNIWKTFPSPSPERAAVVKTAEDTSKSLKRSKREDHSSSSSSSSEDHSPKKKKETKKTKKTKRKPKTKTKKQHHRKEHKKTKKRRRRRARSSTSESSDSEKEIIIPEEKDIPESVEARREAAKFKLAVQPQAGNHVDEDQDEIVGPQPLQDANASSADPSLSYGKALLPGEGQAIAQYVQKNMRIPRRGEVGWQGPEIESLENLGYVMSGSRHSRMNAIRIRKENQVYSAEEKRALALINFEEKQQRENTVMGEFRTMLTAKLTKKHGANVVEDAVEEQ